jgi:outer membrane protein OmpA-like peptidoglycan-associated protein
MNSKFLILTAFVLWCLICVRWYVCGVKEACHDPISIEDPIQTFEPIRDTANVSMGITPTKTPYPDTAGNLSTKSMNPKQMDAVQMEKVEGRMVIHFPFKSTSKEDNTAIDGYLSGLAQQLIVSKSKVRITGHTDFVGESAENYSFGHLRANSIREILVQKGVPKTQVECRSLGDTKPVATNDSPYGRFLNRRVEIQVVQ